MDVLFCCVHSLADGHLDCYHFLSVRNNAITNIGVQVFIWTYILISLGYVPRSVIFGGTTKLLLKAAVPFYISPAMGVVQRFQFLHTLANNYYYSQSFLL